MDQFVVNKAVFSLFGALWITTAGVHAAEVTGAVRFPASELVVKSGIPQVTILEGKEQKVVVLQAQLHGDEFIPKRETPLGPGWELTYRWHDTRGYILSLIHI